jgi:PAS domain S-box-containing protein
MNSSGLYQLFNYRTLRGKLMLSILSVLIMVVIQLVLLGNKLDKLDGYVTADSRNIQAELSDLENHLHQTALVFSDLKSFSNPVDIDGFWSSRWPGIRDFLQNDPDINETISLKRDAQKILKGIEQVQITLGVNERITNEFLIEKASTENFNDLRENLQSAINGSMALRTDLKVLKDDKTEEINLMIRHIQRNMTILGIVLFLLLGFILFMTYRQIQDILGTIHHTTSELKNGNIPSDIAIRKDEASGIIHALNEFFNMLHSVEIFAKDVGKGNFDSQVSVFDNKGDVGESLNEMKESLARVAKEDQQRNWVNSGFAKFGDILRSSHDDIEKLSDDLLSNLIEYLDANQGAIFLLDKNGQDEEETVSAIACYAYNRRKKLGEQIRNGEGLIGAAWQERDTIYLTEIPDDYTHIRSGLGDAGPTSLLIQPLINNEVFVGIIEIASFNEIQKYQIDFIKKLSETIASTISTVYTNSQTKELLEESKQMAEEMKAQEEELRQNMEELEATQEEMRRAQDQIKEKEANLSALIDNTDDTIFALDRNYKITVVNKTLRDKYIGQGIELTIGRNIFEVLPKEMHEHWKSRYDRALSGEKFVKLEERGGNDKRFVETHHNPIRNVLGEVIGCSVIAKDVTDLVNMQNEIRKKESILNTLINNTDDTFFALDRDYRITVINKTLRERFEKTGITMQEGDYIFDILPKDSHSFWKEKYDRSLSGETFEYFQERPVNEKTLYLKAFSRPVFDDDGEVIGASVQSRDITEWKETMLENETLKVQLIALKQKLGIELDQSERAIASRTIEK